MCRKKIIAQLSQKEASVNGNTHSQLTAHNIRYVNELQCLRVSAYFVQSLDHCDIYEWYSLLSLCYYKIHGDTCRYTDSCLLVLHRDTLWQDQVYITPFEQLGCQNDIFTKCIIQFALLISKNTQIFTSSKRNNRASDFLRSDMTGLASVKTCLSFLFFFKSSLSYPNKLKKQLKHAIRQDFMLNGKTVQKMKKGKKEEESLLLNK